MENDYGQFILSIKKKTGIDLSLYKEAQMKRRLTSLRDKRGFSTFSQYEKAISVDHGLLAEFLDRMTINVSEFFRNYKRWEVLEKKILPDLLSQKSSFKAWSAACSTGEEPYTLAMLLDRYHSLNKSTIVATDIDLKIIERAKLGVYPERSLQEVPDFYRKKYFNQDGSFFHISNAMKRAVSFEKHNLLADTYDQSFDLIICRNVLIYFTEEAKNKIYQNFYHALRPGGILFVGSTEQIFNPQSFGFDIVDTFFYKKLP
ncbi:protein-glutamate O-methyltransferase CheR [Bacillaceae bacterium S4-13-58]